MHSNAMSWLGKRRLAGARRNCGQDKGEATSQPSRAQARYRNPKRHRHRFPFRRDLVTILSAK
jgi:hypothetical protein